MELIIKDITLLEWGVFILLILSAVIAQQLRKHVVMCNNSKEANQKVMDEMSENLRIIARKNNIKMTD